MTNDLHPSDDVLVGLALDDIAEADRDPTLAHLSECRRCRNAYDAMSATVEQTLAASPSVEPGPGFDARVLEAIGFDMTSHPSEPTRRALRPWQLVAASLAIGLGMGIGATVAVQQAGDDRARPVLTAGGSFLTTDEGERVGTVTPAYVDGNQVLVVMVTSGRVGMSYQCLLRLANGERVPVADWVLESQAGETWVVQTPNAPVAEMVLVANGGAGPVWSTARL